MNILQKSRFSSKTGQGKYPKVAEVRKTDQALFTEREDNKNHVQWIIYSESDAVHLCSFFL